MTGAYGLVLLLFAAAVLYTSVGHAGASGYLAAMALYGLAPADMRPAALALNLLAATLATAQFRWAGHFDRALFLPLVAGSVPAAFVGGWLTLPGTVYKPVLAVLLFVAAVRLAWPHRDTTGPERRMPPWAAVLSGAAIGLLSGLTGVGGGIYLTPLLLFAGWAETKKAAGVSAAFILVNSVAGLVGRLVADPAALPPQMPEWAAAVLVGGLIGATLGSRVFAPGVLRRLLAVVLVVAALKLAFG
jgi:uncharacterized membrane protein YfcA